MNFFRTKNLPFQFNQIEKLSSLCDHWMINYLPGVICFNAGWYWFIKLDNKCKIEWTTFGENHKKGWANLNQLWYPKINKERKVNFAQKKEKQQNNKKHICNPWQHFSAIAAYFCQLYKVNFPTLKNLKSTVQI